MEKNWRRGVAYVIVWAYAYQLAAWPLLFWATTLLTMWTGQQWPSPVLLPWEHLLTGTATLATISGVDIARDKLVPEPTGAKPAQRL